MNWVSVAGFGVCCGIILSVIKRGADPLSPARVLGFVWSLAIALTELKLSALQYVWTLDSWAVLLTGVSCFLGGTFIAYVLNLRKGMVPISTMRQLLREERVHEGRLFWLICASVAVYSFSYIANYLMRGFLPFFAIEKSRLEFNVSGLTLFLFSISFILFFIVLYHVLVTGRRGRKTILVIFSLITAGSTLLLLSRFQLIMTFVICVAFLYYTTRSIRFRTVLPLLLMMSAFSLWISSIRGSHLIAAFLYHESKMRFSQEYAFFTEPYMYVVMNLENFARTVSLSDYHTYGYYTFDFMTAISGLKYWIVEYFNLNRAPFLVSGYNTYPALWWFYMDFGVGGVALIPLILGFGTGALYYRMRQRPTIKNVTAYAVMFFVVVVSSYAFPAAGLFFELNLLVMYLVLRWVMIPRNAYASPSQASARVGGGISFDENVARV